MNDVLKWGIQNCHDLAKGSFQNVAFDNVNIWIRNLRCQLDMKNVLKSEKCYQIRLNIIKWFQISWNVMAVKTSRTNNCILSSGKTNWLHEIKATIQCFHFVMVKIFPINFDVLWGNRQQGDKQNPQTCSTNTLQLLQSLIWRALSKKQWADNPCKKYS